MKKALTLVFLMLATLIHAQNGSVSGQIIDDAGENVSFATVILKNTADSAMVKADASSLEGEFTFLGIQAGQYFLEVSYVGYQTFISDPIEFDGTEYSFQQIELLTQAAELEEVVVKSTRPIVEVQPDKTVFNVDGSINAQGNTALELLRKSPGVVVDNNDNIILAGKNGVQVYIDGKPSPLSTDDLANFLKSLQSDQIDAIEIITQPSAKYDAEGNAGIINIRLKKDKSLGANGSVNLGYRYGLNAKYNASTNFNYRNKDMNVYGSYGYFDGDFENDFELYRVQGGSIFDQTNDMLNTNTSHSLKLGTDFFVSEKSTLGFLVNANIRNQENYGLSRTFISEEQSHDMQSILNASNDMQGDRDDINANINYAFSDNEKGQTVNIDLDYGRFRNDGYSYQPNTYFDPTETSILSQRIFTNNTPTNIDIYTAKIDHERNLFGGKLGVGAKFSVVQTDNTFDFFDVIDGQEVLNTDRSNNFAYEENINAGYVSYQKQLGEKWNMMLGLRVEQTNSTGDLRSNTQSGDNVVDRNYTDFFPSAGFTYQMSPKNSFRINYSRRIDRPSYQDLNPFEFKLDELSFQKGNPFLNPQYSNSFSLTHTYNYRLNTTLSYTRTNDVFTQITDALDASTTVLTYVNLANQTNISLTVSMPFSVKNWWNVYATTNAYRLINEAVIDNKVIDLKANILSFYAQNTFLLPKNWKLELSGWYNSPGIWQGNWTTQSMYSIDAGVQKSILQNKATLKLSVSDIFKTQRWAGESTFGQLFISGSGQWESRQVRLNFNYNLGSNEVKGARNRRTGLEDEKNRVKSGN